MRNRIILFFLTIFVGALCCFGIEWSIYKTLPCKWYFSGETVERDLGHTGLRAHEYKGLCYQVNDTIRIVTEIYGPDDSFSNGRVYTKIAGQWVRHDVYAYWEVHDSKYTMLRILQSRYEACIRNERKEGIKTPF